MSLQIYIITKAVFPLRLSVCSSQIIRNKIGDNWEARLKIGRNSWSIVLIVVSRIRSNGLQGIRHNERIIVARRLERKESCPSPAIMEHPKGSTMGNGRQGSKVSYYCIEYILRMSIILPPAKRRGPALVIR